MRPSIAVIIPTLNEESIVSQTLVALHHFRFDEIFIVDGGSDDQTPGVAQSYLQGISSGQTRTLLSEKGRARQMNAGAAEARSDILLFLHADTQLPPTARDDIQEAMLNPHYLGGRFDVRFENDQGWAWVISRMMNLRSRLSGIFTGDQAFFIRRSVFQDLGGFADIPLMEDIELSHRLKQRGATVALPSKVTTSFRRWERHGIVRTIIQMWLFRLLYWLGMSPEKLHGYYAPIR